MSGLRRAPLMLAMSTVLTATALAQEPRPQLPAVEFNVEVIGSTIAAFSAKMDAYAALREKMQHGLPALRVTDRPNEIREAERALAARIREARAGARRGDIFTDDIRKAFRQLMRRAANEGLCAAIRDDNPGEFGYDVNDPYPKDRPLSTVPPSIIAVLPLLPPDVWYRFLGRDLILHDSRANIILDRIDDAIPCGY